MNGKASVTELKLTSDQVQSNIGRYVLGGVGRLLSVKLIKCSLVYRPYYIQKLSYQINKSISLIPSPPVEGTMTIIVDGINGRSLVLEDNFKLRKFREPESYCFQLPKLTSERVAEKAVAEARWGVLLKKYRGIAEIVPLSNRLFYRPFWDVEYKLAKRTQKIAIEADDYRTSRAMIKKGR